MVYDYNTPVYAHAKLGALDPDEEITQGMRNIFFSAWAVCQGVGWVRRSERPAVCDLSRVLGSEYLLS